MATNYKGMIQKIKKGEISKYFEKFREPDNKTLYNVLRFYIKMVSSDIINAIKASGENIFSEDYAKKLSEMFNKEIIDLVALDFMKECNNSYTNIDEFFEKNHENLKHTEIRNLLDKKYCYWGDKRLVCN